MSDKRLSNRSNRKIGAILSVANMVTSVIIGLIYTPFVLRTIGQGEYGVYTLAGSIVGYLSILDMGLGKTLVRYVSRAKAEGREDKYINGLFLLMYCVISLVALVIGGVLGLNIEKFFESSFTSYELQQLKSIFHILLVNVAIAFPATVFSAIISSREKFVFSGIVTLLSNVLRHLVICIFLYKGYNSVVIPMISLAATIITLTINVYYCIKKLNVCIAFRRFEKDFYKEVVTFSAFILINIVVDKLYASTDSVILGKICGSTMVSIYGIGVVFQDYFVQLSTAISGVFFPYISKLSTHKDSITEMSGVFLRIGRIQLIILLYILMGFISFGKQFILLWAGTGYEESYLIALLVMLPAVIPLSQNIGISILQALNKHKVRSLMYLCIAILNIVVSIPLSYMFAGVGAAIGTALGNVLGQILFMNWYYYEKIGLNIPEYWRTFFLTVLKSVPVLLIFEVSKLFVYDGWSGFIFKVLFAQLFSIPYYFFVVLNKSEKEIVVNIFSKLRKR